MELEEGPGKLTYLEKTLLQRTDDLQIMNIGKMIYNTLEKSKGFKLPYEKLQGKIMDTFKTFSTAYTCTPEELQNRFEHLKLINKYKEALIELQCMNFVKIDYENGKKIVRAIY